uniref:CSON012358 protein n=1 Tax=Culicoides sonorensis TaxID=179676 RepID=A0A336M5Y3_CULSO
METNYRSLQSGVNSNKRIVSQKLEVSNMSYHQRNPSTNIMLRPVESNAQHKSRSSSNNLTSEHAHGNTPLFLPFAIDSSRGPEFRFVHQGAYATSPYRDMQFIGSPQVCMDLFPFAIKKINKIVLKVSQIEVNRSGPMVSVPNSLSVSFHSNTVDSISSRPRMSLLPHGNDFIQYRPHQLPHVNSENLNQSGLKIETRDLNNSITSGSYHPMVEAISPTGEESNAEELGNAKNELMTHMSKLDSEISETEKTISLLKKKQAMLEETASFKPECQSDETSEHVPKHRSLAQNIYAENRKKALAAHAILNLLGPSNDYPIYNQPKDAQVCQYIIEQHKSFKEKLVRHLKTKKLNNAMRQTETAEKYCQMSLEWNKKVEKIESTLKRKTKEAKSREFFEKVFPELRKQREDKERFNRVGSRIKSEADVEEIIDGLQEQAMEDKKMRSYAVIPPLMLNVEKKRCIFKNENGALIDMEIEFKVNILTTFLIVNNFNLLKYVTLKERQNINVWTSGEKETFKEKFLQHPKNFGAIAASLDRKTAQDCVRYYYLSKKTENYKQLLRKSRQRTRSSKNPQKPNQNSTPSIIDAMTTGVLTRLQREQQQKSGTKERTASNIRSNNSVTPSSNIAVNNNNISLTIGCENVEPISVTNNIHSKQIDMFPASNTISLNTRKVEENELIVPSSPKHEMKSALMESSCQKTPDEIFKTSESRTESLNFEETDEHRIIDHISTVESLNDSTG